MHDALVIKVLTEHAPQLRAMPTVARLKVERRLVAMRPDDAVARSPDRDGYVARFRKQSEAARIDEQLNIGRRKSAAIGVLKTAFSDPFHNHEHKFDPRHEFRRLAVLATRHRSIPFYVSAEVLRFCKRLMKRAAQERERAARRTLRHAERQEKKQRLDRMEKEFVEHAAIIQQACSYKTGLEGAHLPPVMPTSPSMGVIASPLPIPAARREAIASPAARKQAFDAVRTLSHSLSIPARLTRSATAMARDDDLDTFEQVVISELVRIGTGGAKAGGKYVSRTPAAGVRSLPALNSKRAAGVTPALRR